MEIACFDCKYLQYFEIGKNCCDDRFKNYCSHLLMFALHSSKCKWRKSVKLASNT